MTWLFTLCLLMEPNPNALTAAQAVQIGLQNNYQVQIARTDAEIAAENVNLAKADRLPQVDARANASYNYEQQSTNSPFAFGDADSRSLSAAVTFNWRLFDGYRLVANQQRFEYLSELEQTHLQLQMENTVVEILQSYYDLVRIDALLEVAQNSLAVSEDRLEKLNLRRELGGVNKTEVLDAQVARNNDRAAVLEQKLQRERVTKQLNQLLARPVTTPIEVVDTIPIQQTLPDEAQIRNDMLGINSEVQAARLNRQIAEQDITIANAAFLPKVDLNAGVDWSDSRLDPQSSDLDFGAIDTTSTNASISLGVTFNLFDGRRKHTQRATAEMALKRQELAIEALELQLEQSLSDKLQTLRQRLELLELEAANIEVARENLELTNELYRLGGTSSLDFRDAQLNLTRAQANLVNTQYLIYLTQLDLQQLSGKLLAP